MPTETIREFVARIGYSIDEPSERRFMQGMEGAVLKANLLADALANMARAVAEKVGQVAEGFERLGYAARNVVGTSANEIKAFGMAAAQWGGHFDTAMKAIITFGDEFRNLTPAADNFTRSILGIKTEIDGVKRSSTDVFIDIAKELSTKPPMYQEMFRKAFPGIDMETLRAFMQNPGAEATYRERLATMGEAGITPETYQNMARFERAWRDILDHLSIEADAFSTKLANAATPALEKLDEEISKTIKHPGTNPYLEDFMKLFGLRPATAEEAAAREQALSEQGARIEKWAQDVETYIERLPFWKWLLGIRIGSGPVPFGGIGESGATDIPVPESSGGGIGGWLGRAWGGVKSLFGGNGGAPSTKGLDPALDAKIKAKAEQWGIDPVIARRVYASEGGGSNLGYMQPGDNGTSFGPFQLHRGGPGSVGTEYEKQTGFSVEDPKHIDDYLDFTMDWVRNHGWGAWSGARKQGIEGYQGVGPLPVARSTPAPDYSPPAPLKPAAPSPSEHPTWFAPKGQQPWEMPSHAWDRLNKALPTEDPNVAALKSAASIDTSKVVNFGGVTNNVTVNAPDPHSAAAMVGLHLDRNAHDLVTNLQGSVQ